jgi:lipid-binding SYLF domain-containing protein
MKVKLAVIAAMGAAALVAQEGAPDHRLREAASDLHEIMSAPDKGIPHSVLERSQCVAVLPGVKKAAFVVGGEYGKGYAICRHHGRWGSPAAIRLAGGSFGAQIGAESADIVLLIMNQSGMDKLASDKFTIGADASAAAGPVGRTASADTDVLMRAEILSYSRTRGAFAGVSLDGTSITKDEGEDRKIYGHDVSNKAVIMGEVHLPLHENPLAAELDHYAPGRKK